MSAINAHLKIKKASDDIQLKRSRVNNGLYEKSKVTKSVKPVSYKLIKLTRRIRAYNPETV